MSVFDWIVPFLLLLGVLIFFHELGHFLIAKWCGVKVEKFSLGFGPVLLSKRVGETEYAISALPLGGFVKMLGELPGETLAPEERDRAFNYKAPWQRISIALAGPAMNLILPVFLIAGAVMAGKPEFTSRIGGVVPDGVAARAGLLPGDRIVAVDGRPVEWWSDVLEALRAGTSQDLHIDVERTGERLGFELRREQREGGWSPVGINASAPAAVVSVIPGSAAQAAGIEVGDRVVRLGSVAIGDRFVLETELARAEAPLEVELSRRIGSHDETRVLTLAELPAERTLAALGLAPLDHQVFDVDPLTPAHAAGVQAGDVVLSVDGAPIHSAAQLIERVRGSEGRKLELVVLRAGETRSLTVEPALQPVPGAEGLETHYALGVRLEAPMVEGEQRERVIANPFEALSFGAQQTAFATAAIGSGFVELFSGSVGLGSLSGPIGIGAAAAHKFRASWLEFLDLMVLISINLALLNLLPIPVLDGGTIVMTLAEWLRGGPLSLRARDWAQTVGLGFILLLMGVAFWNDLWKLVRNLG
jgi:regulator of sigma E protease